MNPVKEFLKIYEEHSHLISEAAGSKKSLENLAQDIKSGKIEMKQALQDLTSEEKKELLGILRTLKDA